MSPDNKLVIQEGTVLSLGPNLDADPFIPKAPIEVSVGEYQNGWRSLEYKPNPKDPKSQAVILYQAVPLEPKPSL